MTLTCTILGGELDGTELIFDYDSEFHLNELLESGEVLSPEMQHFDIVEFDRDRRHIVISPRANKNSC